MSAKKQYLGDGVYVDLENGMLKLTAEDGIRELAIWLEPEVFVALVAYVKHHAGAGWEEILKRLR